MLQAAKLEMVDFDWAGKAAQVFYPVRRHDQINSSVPAGCSPAIEAGHDRQTDNSWWQSFAA
ncbi:hypothetical protein SCP_0115690 [Sparassis crispa]|uniref:Uncharacterized protein n=1 Tax=Sparassis crispa TaxID=139825 RepID=A0A401G943_9APHY|nr:hypothetical protein SCP_0115690 [Sparassis crispa]GBE78678.1 hypothetical protein SCP_0115690 [Sparassis crispa]